MDTVAPRPAAPAKPVIRALRFVRSRIPRSLVLAVLGIGLSSWLLPAVTRQWDDRQKAGELKAALVSEMATATGRALLDAQAFSYTPAGTRPSPAATAGAVKEWSVAALQIRARLDAYFGSDAVAAWEGVTRYVDATLSRAYRTEAHDAFVPGRRSASTTSGRLQKLYGEFYGGSTTVIDQLVVEILRQEEVVARGILGMRVHGYSTTWDDILRDLLPTV